MKVLHGEQRQGDQTDLVTHKAQALPSPQQSEPGAKPPPLPGSSCADRTAIGETRLRDTAQSCPAPRSMASGRTAGCR